MMAKVPFETKEYELQTEMKHKAFREYFDKWVKILGSKFGTLNYVDGFAGLGAYDRKGKLYFGSPIIAAEVLRDNKKFVKDATLIFIDNDANVIKNLKKVVEYRGLDKCDNLEIHFEHNDFNKAINESLEETKRIAPTFVFVDPFGFGDIKYDTFKTIMDRIGKPEILINFMYNAVTRFLEDERLVGTFTEVFGTEKWKEIVDSTDDREEKIINLYVTQLRKLANFAFPYRLTFPRIRRTYYYLIHLTNHHLGATIMKSSFAKYTYGKVEWLGVNASQTSLVDILGTRINEIKNYLLEKYDQKSVKYLKVVVDNIDKTAFLESQIKKAIKALEKDGVVYVERFPKLGRRTGINENDIIYFNTFPSIKRKSLLYRTKVEYGNFTINHVFGCSHGCDYPCYAFMMARTYGKAKDYEDWIHPRIVSNALALLDKEIPKYRKEIDFVHMSFTTDPFMYDFINKRTFPPIKDLTLKIIEKLNKNGIKVTILTKGNYPEELIEKRFNVKNEYGITLVSLDKQFKKKFEPFSAPYDDRIRALKFLSKKGLRTWVSIEPYPTPNIVKQDIEQILKKVSFTDKIIFGKMNYNVKSKNFENNESFYKDSAKMVIDFCRENDIQLHIKEGTPYSKIKSRKIFRTKNNSQKKLS
jgi:three-Cys-motif partner protein